MSPKGHVELAHPQAADWVMGTLGPGEAVGFQLHLKGCPHCQAAVAEFGQLGQMLRHLPPAAELPPALEARTIASILEAAAEDRTPTQVHQIPGGLAAAAQDPTAAEVHHVPEASPAAAGTPSPPQLTKIPPASPQTGPAPAQTGPAPPQTGSAPAQTGPDEQPGGVAKVIRFLRWPGRAGLVAIASAVAAAIITAVLILPGLGGGVPEVAFAFKLVAPAGSAQAASGTAVARQDSSSGSWDVTLTVHHLGHHDPAPWYECWYVSRDGQKAVSAGTFLVPGSGSGTFPMTSAADPGDFQKMEITLQSPTKDGALQSKVVLSGEGKKL